MNKPTGRLAPKPGTQQLAAGQALHLGRQGGELRVMQGCVWLTHADDWHDYFVESGQSVQLTGGECAVIEPASRYRPASLRWTPRRHGLARRLLAGPLRGAAWLSSHAAGGFAALASLAAAGANRIQGQLELPEVEVFD